MKKLFCFLLLCAFALCSFSTAADVAGVDTSAAAFVLFCADNGEILLSENADKELPMASTTKIMTTLLTLEESASDNRIVEFTDEMIAEGSSMYLDVGEKVTLYDLAVGMMMQSGNDAANAAAIGIAGSIGDFADLMNAKAQQLGMTHTHFVTPSGLDDPEHYSCAEDMARLMAYALKNDDFAAITSQSSMTVDFSEPEGKTATYPNHNRLLKMYDGCIGGKTGYTDKSGRCLVSAARRDGLTLIAVTLDDRDDWNDHITLYDYGFERYSRCSADDRTEYTVEVMGGTESVVRVKPADVPSFVIEREKADSVVTKAILPRFVFAPVREGERVGEIRYYSDGELLSKSSLVVDNDVIYDDKKRDFIEYIKDILNWHS